MKHLRIVNLLVVLVLLAGWAPAPVQLFNGVQAPLSALAPTLVSPASGYIIPLISSTFNGTLTFKWNAVAGTNITYNLDLATDFAFTQNVVSFSGLVATNQAVDTTTLIGNDVYYWRVSSVENGGAPVSSLKRIFYTRPNPPSTGFIPADGGDVNSLSPVLTFGTADNVVKYDFRIMLGATLVMSRIVVVTAGTPSVSVPVTAILQQGKTYSWMLRSYGQLSMFSPWKVLTFKTPPDVPPAPVLTSPTLGAVLVDPHGYDTTLTWTQPTPANSAPIFYHIQVATSTTFAPNTLIVGQDPNTNITATGVTTFPVTVPAGGIYFWRVQGEDTRFGSNGVLSTWSKVYNFKTPPSLKVTVKDCVNGVPISGATVTFTGTGGETLTTDSNGMVSKMPVVVGYHAITINKLVNNLAGDYLQLKLPSTLYSVGKAYTFNVCLKRQQIRIVMRWGSSLKPGVRMPYDLDTHVWMPSDISPVTKPVMQIYPGQWGSTVAHPWMKLMNDAYGVAALKAETTYIINRYPGKYMVAVRNLSSYDAPVAGSGAQVQVFLSGSLVPTMVIKVDDAQIVNTSDSRWWYVMDISTNADGSLTLSSVNQVMANLPQPPFYDVNAGLSVTK